MAEGAKGSIDIIYSFSVAAYVQMIKTLKYLLTLIGIIWILERYLHFKWILYIRSLFSIFDAADLVKLDLHWWSFGAVDHINNYLNGLSGQAVVLEWGSGASTVWLARRSKKVYTLEHDIEWSKTTKTLISDYKNVKLITVPPDGKMDELSSQYISKKPGYRGLNFNSYVNAINKIDEKFDLIAIDGRCRSACLKLATSKLKPNGIVLFDDSKRSRYQKALVDSGLMIKRYKGMNSGVPFFPYETVVLTSNKLAAV